jgi:DNA polymerase-3 subunit beta
MQFVFKTAETLELLTGLFKFKPKNPAVVDLENFCFEIINNQMFAKIYDLETMVKAPMPVQIFNCTEPMSFMIDAQEVIDFLKSFSPTTYPDFSLDVDMDKEICFLSIPKFKQQLPCYSGEEYPKIAGLPSTITSFSIPNFVLYNIINRGLETVATDVLRPALCGIYFEVDTDKHLLTTVSTNAKIMFTSVNPATIYVKDELKNFILNGEIAKKIKHLLPKKVKNILDIVDCKIRFNGEKAIMNIGKFALITRVTDAKYPDYKVVMPTDDMIKHQVSMDRNVLLDAIKLVEKSANKQTKAIKFTFDKESLKLYAHDIDLNKSAETETTVQKSSIKEGIFEIAFPFDQIKTLMYLFETDNMVFHLSAFNRAVLIKEAKNENDTALIMPLMLDKI